MTSHPLTLHEPDLLQRNATCQRRSTLESLRGPLTLQSFCPPSLVASLKAESGLHAFAHVPEREHQLLLGIAERPERWHLLVRRNHLAKANCHAHQRIIMVHNRRGCRTQPGNHDPHRTRTGIIS